MTNEEFIEMIDNEPAGPPYEGFDLTKDALKIMAGHFPKMRRMKRRLAFEFAFLLCFLVGSWWLYLAVPGVSMWVPVATSILIPGFMALQILAFHAYWYTPYSASYAELTRKCARRINLITDLMKYSTLASLLIFTLIMVYGTNMTQVVVTWNAVLALYAVPVTFLFFSQRWVANAKIAQEMADENDRGPGDVYNGSTGNKNKTSSS